MEDKPNLFKRIFSSLWFLTNTLRKVIINLVFFTVLLIVILASSSDKDLIVVPEKTALVLNLRGDIVEQKRQVKPIELFMNDALGQEEDKPEILLSNLIEVISKAKDDQRIQLLVLDLRNLGQSGLTKLRDVADAITDFKQTNKQVIALGDYYTQDQYYLASYADEIWLNPQGAVLIEGYGRYPLYFKSALDKLKISQHIFRVGTFKSAVEPYMRDNMSDAAKEANKQWLSQLWQIYKEDVAKQRGFSVDNFDETADALVAKFAQDNSNFAEYALKYRWVDALKTRENIRNALTALVGENKKKTSFSQISYKDYLATITKPQLPLTEQPTDKVAIVVAKGPILDGEQEPGLIGGDSTAKLLRKARKDKHVKAVVLRVDSPGGSAFASEIIRQEIELIKASGKPVIASMGTYAASGGYWISAPADQIYAAPTTITGSIGIFGMFMTIENSLKELGINSDGVGTTDFASFSVTRPLPEGIAQLFQLNINRGYHDFISLVAKNRGMTLAEVDAIAQGRVWTGQTAKTLGLVDQLGNLDDAIAAAAKLAKLDSYETLLIEKELSPRDKLLQNILTNANSWFGSASLQSQNHKTPLAAFMASFSQELTKINLFNDPQGMYLYCDNCAVN
jgi:protease-4